MAHYTWVVPCCQYRVRQRATVKLVKYVCPRLGWQWFDSMRVSTCGLRRNAVNGPYSCCSESNTRGWITLATTCRGRPMQIEYTAESDTGEIFQNQTANKMDVTNWPTACYCLCDPFIKTRQTKFSCRNIFTVRFLKSGLQTHTHTG